MAAITASDSQRWPSSRMLSEDIRANSIHSPGSRSGRSAQAPLPLPSEESLEAASKAALEEIENDPIFSKFLAPDFNSTKFASQALSSGSALASSRKLNDGISLLEKHLRSEVVLRHDQLLQQLTSLRDTESVLAVVRAGVDSLQASVQRVRSEVAVPYRHVKLKTRQLANLHATIELMRAVIRVLKQMRRLRDQLAASPSDLSKSAQIYSAVQEALSSYSGVQGEGLQGVWLVEAELQWLAQAGAGLRAQALAGLEQGIGGLNQAEVGAALQVFFNMGELRQAVDGFLGKTKSQALKAIAASLDIKAISSSVGPTGLMGMPGGISRAGGVGVGMAPKGREALWQRLLACFDTLHQLLAATWHLQRVLAKKRDPISHVIFLDQVLKEGEASLTDRVWEWVARALTAQLKAAFTTSSFVKETFVHGFPRLLAMADSLLDRLHKDTHVKGVPPCLTPADPPLLLAALEPYQSAYLGQSLARCTDMVNSMLPAGYRGSIPSLEVVPRLAALVREELEAVKGSQALTALVLRGVGKALLLLAERAEYQLVLSPDARQVSLPATSAQTRNMSLCLLLQECHVSVTALLLSLSSQAAGQQRSSSSSQAQQELELERGLDALKGVASAAVAPLFTSLLERLEASILQLHEQGPRGPEEELSPYMADTVGAMAHFQREFLSKLLPAGASSRPAHRGPSQEPICAELTKRLAARVLLFYLRHLSLVRPLDESLKLQLARDMAELEFAIGSHLAPPEQLGGPYRALRAFRPLMFLDTHAVQSSPLLKDLPPSVVLLHLFSRAPAELQSPLQRNGLTAARFSLWLDMHSEEDAWKEVKASLDAYARTVQSRGDKEFHPLYPVMLALGRSLLED